MDMKLCDECGYRHGSGRCCIDVYRQLGQTKGPSVTPKVLLTFVAPLLVFIGSLVVAGYVLSVLVAQSNARGFYAFLIALAVTVLFVQLIRLRTRTVDTQKETTAKHQEF